MDSRKETDGSTTSYGLWRYGNDFYRAAVTLNENHNEQGFMPFYSTIGQSIELSLKAFLLAKDIDIKTLSHEYRHNLNKLISKSRELNLESIAKLNNAHIAAIDLMSDEYLKKKYHYIKTGRIMLPENNLIIQAAHVLTINLETYCKENTKWEYA